MTAGGRGSPAPTALVGESIVFAASLLKRWWRRPIVPIQALVFPTFLLVTYFVLVGKSIARLTGTDNLDGLVPVCAVAGAMFGALGAGLALPAERRLLSRYWTFPVHRASPVVGRLLAEAVRTLAGAVLITGVGLLLGLRFQGSWWATIPFLLVPVAVVIVFAAVVITVGLKSRGNTMFTWLATGSIALVFCNSGIAQLNAFPVWLRPIIEYQPMSPVIETMRSLVRGELATAALLATTAWTVGLAVVFVPLAVRGFRDAAETG